MTTNDQHEKAFQDQIAHEIASTPNRLPSVWDRLQWAVEACRYAQRAENNVQVEQWVLHAQEQLQAAVDGLRVTAEDLRQEYKTACDREPLTGGFRAPACPRCGCRGFRPAPDSDMGACKVCGMEIDEVNRV